MDSAHDTPYIIISVRIYQKDATIIIVILNIYTSIVVCGITYKNISI